MKKEDFRRLTGVTPVTELPLGRQPLAVRHPSEEMVAVRPVLVVTDDPSSARARAHADAALRGGQAVIRQGELWWHDFLMSTWRRCLAEQRGRNLSAADQIGAEKRKLGE